jgi:hypothetical protein
MTTRRGPLTGASLIGASVIGTALTTLAWAVVVPAVGPGQLHPAPAADVRMTATTTTHTPTPPAPLPANWRGARLHRYDFPGGGRVTAI